MIEHKIETIVTAKMELNKDSDKTTTKKPLSFSISSILGDSNPKKPPQDAEIPRVPSTYYSTIHHYGHPVESTNYQHFESHMPPRACSTPENEYPSPTPSMIPSVYRTMQGQFATPNAYPLAPLQHGHYYKRDVSPASRDNDNCSPELDVQPRTNDQLFEKSIDKSLDSLGESYQQSPSPFKSKKKKTRTVFSRSQVYQLESAFDMKRYLSSTERSSLANSLNLSETQIKIWFQNRRNKWKRQINGEMDEIPIPPAFAASYPPSTLAAPLSHPTYGSMIDSREGLYRSGLSVPSYYSHPYSRETSFIPRDSYLSGLK